METTIFNPEDAFRTSTGSILGGGSAEYEEGHWVRCGEVEALGAWSVYSANVLASFSATAHARRT